MLKLMEMTETERVENEEKECTPVRVMRLLSDRVDRVNCEWVSNQIYEIIFTNVRKGWAEKNVNFVKHYSLNTGSSNMRTIYHG